MAGVSVGNFFGHHWYVGTDAVVNEAEFAQLLDDNIKKINDDYGVERLNALKEVFVTVLPEETFLAFMELKGKTGAQHKFPRVIKGTMLEDWKAFLSKDN